MGFNTQHNSLCLSMTAILDLMSISHLEFYRACNCATQKIGPGRAGADKEIVALATQTPSGIRGYHLHWIACM